MAATKRNAGLTSAVPRATLNNEELVSYSKSLNKFYKNTKTNNKIIKKHKKTIKA